MRIAIAKPDVGVVGGFERVLDRVRSHLRGCGHEVVDRNVAVGDLGRTIHGLTVPEHVWHRCPEYFRYLGAVQAFQRLDVADADVVISTQPPSFAVDHPRVVALFYHHQRIYYDLARTWVQAGFEDPDLHAFATERVRSVDGPALERVAWYLAGSAEVAGRLAEFNGRRDRVSLFRAGADVEPVTDVAPPGRGPALCVSRSEFPKRTELFAVASHHLPGHPFVLVGDGGRLPFVRALHARLSAPGADPSALTDSDVWLNRGVAAPAAGGGGHLRLAGRVGDAELDRLYRQAGCVVAPAHREDYGLTVLEAQARGRPVVVCRDGGGLVDLVEDGVTGFVVDPSGAAIAEAVARLRDDPDLARAMGEAGREALAAVRWEDALRALDQAVDAARSTS